jgi:Tol biopolymer transport system component
VVPFTSLPGVEQDPAFSPDGNQLAYVWVPPDGSNPSIYVKLIGAGTVLRLTTPREGRDFRPAWSPDGRQIAFCREFQDGAGVYVISVLGGPERLVARRPKCPSFDWLPDGKRLVATGPPTLSTITVETGEVGTLTSLQLKDWTYDDLTVSPDGKTLAFIRWFAANDTDIYLMALQGGRTTRLTRDGVRIWGLAWLPDSSGVVFASSRAGGAQRLWRLPVAGGTPARSPPGNSSCTRQPLRNAEIAWHMRPISEMTTSGELP